MTDNEALELVEQLLNQGHLTDLQKIIFRGSWRGLSYNQILAEASQQNQYCSYGHLKNESSDLWKLLTNGLDPKVTQGTSQNATIPKEQPTAQQARTLLLFRRIQDRLQLWLGGDGGSEVTVVRKC